MSAEEDVLAELEREGLVAAVVPSPANPMGAARQLVQDLYTDQSRLVLRTHRNDLYCWDGACWPEAEASGVRGTTYKYLESAVYEAETKKGESISVPWQPTRRKIGDVLDALKAITYLDGKIQAPSWLGSHASRGDDAMLFPPQEIVAMANGLLHFPSRQLLPHTPDFFAHHSLPFEFNPDAPSPRRWLHFLGELWANDVESISTLQEIFGYIIGGGTEQQKMFLLIGPKRSGKGTIGRVLRGLLGHHNVDAPTFANLATNFGLSTMIGRPLALISDARLSGKADSGIVVERLLSISGEDALTIDRKYRQPWTGKLPTRFVVLTNMLPRLSDSSGALASRFIMLVFTQDWYGRENPKLTEELLEEAPSIFNWALEGLDRLTERGYFKPPRSSREAVRQLEDLASPMATFLRERCQLEADASVAVEALWGEWKTWCEDSNQGLGTKAIFGRDLRAASPLVRKIRPWKEKGPRPSEYSGIRLLQAGDDPDSSEDLGRQQWPVTRTAVTVETDNGGSHGSHGSQPTPSTAAVTASHGSHGDGPLLSPRETEDALLEAFPGSETVTDLARQQAEVDEWNDRAIRGEAT